MKSENNIPKFDLAEQILAEQRKTASIKRKSPVRARISDSNKNSNEKLHPYDVICSTGNNPCADQIENKANNIQYTIHNTNNGEQIIAEIVARDIKQFRSKRV